MQDTLKHALKRGALIAAANWPVVVVQEIADSLFKLLLAMPLIGGIFLVALVLGAEPVALLSLGWRDLIATIVASLVSRPLVLTADERAVTFTNVFLTTLLNPKALIFSLTVIPWAANTLAWYFVGFAATVIAAGGGWIVVGNILRGATGSRAGVIPKVASVVLVGFAGLILRAAF